METAISFVLLCTLIFGTFEGALAVYDYHFLANAAHEGTRYAIVRGGGWGQPCDTSPTPGSGYGSSGCVANAADVANYVAGLKFPGINIPAGQVCVQYFSGTPASTVTPCTVSGANAANTPGDIVQVTINYPYVLMVPGVPRHTFTLTATSQMTISQ